MDFGQSRSFGQRSVRARVTSACGERYSGRRRVCVHQRQVFIGSMRDLRMLQASKRGSMDVCARTLPRDIF
jgi:hypothetical protein